MQAVGQEIADVAMDDIEIGRLGTIFIGEFLGPGGQNLDVGKVLQDQLFGHGPSAVHYTAEGRRGKRSCHGSRARKALTNQAISSTFFPIFHCEVLSWHTRLPMPASTAELARANARARPSPRRTAPGSSIRTSAST